MIPIISVVGRSNVGKTTLLEKLLRELKKRGYRVATIKHDVHGFEMDKPGKDTWRHAQAGADVVVISSSKRMAMLSTLQRERTIDEIASLIQGVDLIITEGYKTGNKPKIEVFRSVMYPEPLCKPQELLAIASDVALELEVPCFGLDDASGIVDLISAKYLA